MLLDMTPLRQTLMKAGLNKENTDKALYALYGSANESKLHLNNPIEVAKFAAPFIRKKPYEHIMVITVDANLAVLSADVIAQGTSLQAGFSPQQVFRAAMKNDTAYAIYLVHNHPSGLPTPSKADVAATISIQQGGKILNIPLLAHVIVAPDGKFDTVKINLEKKNG